MTFGVNALDWTNIGRKLQTRLAETVGETLSSTVTESVLTPFEYYDAATGAVLTTYSAYLDTTSNPPDIVTVKTDEDGANVVIDITPLTLLYNAVDSEGNAIITSDSSAEGVESDEQGMAIPLSPSSAEYSDNLQTVFKTAVETDTGWSPDYQMTDGSLTSGDSNTQYAFDYQTVDEVSNSDGTSWLRLRQLNGIENIYYYLPYSSETEYTTLVDSIPAEFTFADDFYLFPAGTELTAESVESGSASTVEATSVSSTLLSSTYDTSLTDLNTAYEAVLSGDITGGGNGGNTGGSDSCPDNATYNTKDAKCKCDDGYKPKMTTDGSGKLLECNVKFIHGFTTDTWPKIEEFILDNKFWILGGGFVALGGLGWISGMFRGSKKPKEEKQTLGQLLDNAIGSGKEIEG